MTINRWCSVASFLLSLSFTVAPFIYLVGNVRDTIGVLAYDLADFIYGPIFSASLIFLVYMLRENIGKRASRRTDLALLAAVLAAVGMAGVAFIRASNRHYHLLHPELHLENDATVLIIWATLVAGVNGIGFHFLGWTFILLASASWTSRFFPRPLTVLYFITGIASLFVYLVPEFEGVAWLFGMVIGIWQGVWLWFYDTRRQ